MMLQLDTMEDDNMSSDCDSDGDGDDRGRGGGGCGGLFGGFGGLVSSNSGFSGGLWRPSAQPADPCYRCGKRVYPVERVDVGVLFHRRCFRCRTCGLQLTLRTFHWDNGGQVQGHNQGQSPPNHHDNQLHSPQSTGSISSCFFFGAGSPPSNGHGNGNGNSVVGSPIPTRSKVDCKDQGQSSRTKKADVYCHVHVPRAVGRIDGEAVGIKQALSAPRRGPNTCDQTRGSVYNPGWQYDANALEFAHYKELFRRGKQKTCTGTWKDFEDSGVWAAQSQLEAVQKAEEDELYEEIRAERQRRVRRLEDELQHEMETTVQDLVTTFERFSPQKGKTKLEKETERIEEQYRRKKEEKCRKMLERLSSEQRARVASLIQKHSQQMLELIAEKLTSLEERSSSESESRSPIMDLSRAPYPSPPEFKRAQLFKSPAEFAKIDNHVFEIAKRHYSSFSRLVKDLIVDCETDLEKARAIFRWVTLADLNEMEFGDCDQHGPESPMGLLRGIKFGTETYHDLCRRLCSYAGLHCEVIQGYSKGAGYKPGMKLEGSRFRNSWTAVCIDGSWCFLNCNWGARHVRAANSNDDCNPITNHHSHRSHEGGRRRRRGSCAKENIDCRVNSNANNTAVKGGGGVGGVQVGSYEGGLTIPGSYDPPDPLHPHPHPYNNGSNNVIITTTAAQSCSDVKHIVDNNNESDHSLLRFGRDKDSPLRQLFRYASGDLVPARNGDRNSGSSNRSSTASGQSSDRTSTGSATTTSSMASKSDKSDCTHSDSNGSNGSSDSAEHPHSLPQDCTGAWGLEEEEAGDEGKGKGREGVGKDGEREGEDGRQRYHYQCDEFYFITDPEDHIFQHYPDDPEWQLLECPITLCEFINLPVLKSPFFNYGLKLATHYDCKQVTESGLVNITLRIPHLLGFGYTLEPKDKRMSPYILQGRVMLRIVGHKAIFTVAPPKRGRYYFTIYAKDDWLSESLQSACAFQIRCKEGREILRSPYPKVSFFGPTPSAAVYGLLPQTHIDPVVTYSHDDLSFHFQLPRHVRLSYALQFHGQAPDAVDADFQRYVFLRNRDDNSISFLVRCPHVGKYVFALYGSRVDSPDETSSVCGNNGNPNTPAMPYECLFRYLIECKQSATNKAPFPRACHRWYQSHLLEPMVGDLDTNRRVTFRLRAPLAAEVALLMGDAWFHFRPMHDYIWEATVITSKTPCAAKLYARLNRDTSRFSPLLEFQIVPST